MVSLGLVLVGGFVFVMAVLVGKINGSSTGNASTCPSFAIVLPAEASLQMVEANRDLVSMLATYGDGRQELLRYDGCHGGALPPINLIAPKQR